MSLAFAAAVSARGLGLGAGLTRTAVAGRRRLLGSGRRSVMHAARGGKGAGFATVQVEEVVEKMNSGQQLQLIDVREGSELAIVKIDGFMHLPLSENESWAPKIDSGELLDRDTPTYCLCHHGIRSAQMCNFLVLRGFEDVNNISGGVDEWAQAYNMDRY